MKYLLNPLTGQIRYASPLEAKRLARYGWTYTTRAEWLAYQQAQIQQAIKRNIPSMRTAFGGRAQ